MSCSVTLNGHQIQGNAISDSGKHIADQYLAVPYALPPTGSYRWRPPRPLPRDHVYPLECKTWGNVCPQPIYMANGKPVIPMPPGTKFDEDCLHINIWVPKKPPPPGGFPVLVWLHGGWLQIGIANHYPNNDPSAMMAETDFNAIVVAVSYRLNVFGFLASKELLEEDANNSNFGLLDQRLAIEWVYDNIAAFGGNPENITLGGHSAGAFSTHYQVCNELFSKDTVRPIIKRFILQSNAIPVLPKTLEESQPQTDAVFRQCNIASNLNTLERLDALRAIPAQELADVLLKLDYHTFRPFVDGRFISADLIKNLCDGTFADAFKKRNMSLFIGEVSNEAALYGATNTPKSYQDFVLQLHNYYPKAYVNKLAQCYTFPTQDLPAQEINALFGQVASDLQVYMPTRHLVSNLVKHGVGLDKIFRYKVDWIPNYMKAFFPAEWGVTHGMDGPVFWFPRNLGLTDDEAMVVKQFQKHYVSFLQGTMPSFGATSVKHMLVLKRDGTLQVENDTRWDNQAKLCEAIFQDKL